MEAGRFVYVLTIAAMVVGCYSSGLYEEWRDYKTTFNKTYLDSDDEEYRRSVWMENVQKIKQHNIEANMGLHTFWLKMNHLGDMSTNEINQVMNNLKPELLDRVEENNSHNANTGGEGVPEMFQVDDNVDRKFSNRTEDVSGRVPDSIDWRKKGYVTAVKYQGHCGACYAFSATGALEGQHARRTGKLVSLSEQNLVDCTYYNRYKDKGCHGGLMDHAFRYVIDNGGIDTETSYPYRATVSTCKFNSRTVGAKAKGYRDILPRGDENKLKEAVGTMGPVSIGIDAHSFWFHFYSYGVFDSWFCRHKLNHGVLAVGYGSEYGKDYWIVKNSWGWWWGDRGYIKMSRNKNNQCGIASLGSIPIV